MEAMATIVCEVLAFENFKSATILHLRILKARHSWGILWAAM